jgi:hypothetical protein
MGDLVLDAIAAGQLQAMGALIDPMVRAGEGRALAVIGIRRLVRVPDPAGGDRPSRDLYGALAHVPMIRKILLRMRSWQSYIFSKDI